MNCRAYYFCLILFVFLLGCSTGNKIRHLSSDVCLVFPESTKRQEVISFLGQPDSKWINEEKLEVWAYVTTRHSFLRKTPLVGNYMGKEEYEVVTVTFNGDIVRTCFYRNLNKEQYDKFSSENGLSRIEE